MKKVMLALLLSTGVMFAGANDKADRVKTMQGLETAMAAVQKGFFYNSEGMVQQGIKDFKSQLRNINSFVIDVDEKDQVGKFNPRDYAHTETKAIKELADDVLKNFKTGTKHESVAVYSKMMNRCLTCHAIIRKW